MPTPSLIRVRCLDAERAVGLVNYADMVVYDQEKNVVALRIGGYPETVQAMSDAILGGCELELTGSKSSLCLNSKGRRNYARRISHDGVYAEGIHWLQDDSLQSLAVGQDDDDPKSEKETVSLKRNLYIFCTSSDELFDELDRKLSVPLLPEFRGYFLSEVKKRGLLNRLKVYCPGQKFQCWHMRVSKDSSIRITFTINLGRDIDPKYVTYIKQKAQLISCRIKNGRQRQAASRDYLYFSLPVGPFTSGPTS